ncbi:MAG: aminopeptidase [Candidatus Eisenbacteria bacterium]|nr:aminopeptidase [Candidatus Eisenbacteria bacterium]
MTDPRYEKLAKVLVDYSVEVEKGDLVGIQTRTVAEPLTREIYRECIRAGAHPFVRCGIPGLTEIFFKEARKHQLEFVNPISREELERLDKVISLWADENTKELANVDPDRQRIRAGATAPLMKRWNEREAAGELKWVGTQFPTNASAQDAEMSLSEYEDFVLKACLVHRKDPIAAWKSVHRKQAKICRRLDKAKKIRVVTKGTDLSMVVEGRKWVNCDGKANMPDGEIFTGPVENSVEGKISFSFPAFYYGREAEGVQLTFKKGEVAKAKASKNQDFLEAMLNTDEGARRVGEFAIGTNYSVQQFTRNTLFDEKIGGTVHMAVGSSIPESRGVNESGIHWDMVTDMRDGGKIYADGKIVYKDGKFVID